MNVMRSAVTISTTGHGDAHSNVEHSNLKNSDDKDTEKRINKLKKSLKNRYPSQLDYIEAYIVKDLPVIYAVTPTYTRWTQKADLTRLAQTLLHVPNLHWIVVEDAERKTPLVTKFLKYSGLQYTHLNSKTDANYKLKADDPNWLLPRGVAQRNVGLSWIRKNVPPSTSGVLYLMDDDNTYSLKLFEEMRTIATAAVWPVGLTGGLKFEGPGSCSGGKVLSWYTAWKPERPFPIDMAGFAVNLKLFFQHKNAEFSNKVPRGYLESHFLTSLDLTRDDVEGKVEDCSEILVWHTRTEKATLKQEAKLISMGNPSNPDIEV
ncbi:unnamed protein product [Clavelina lepadiformis]|uniref:Galactosylgalactosylxylosylprotein 3-beta-glucuronosyltransferase n=1 Tax=Clavelina lepadiformis TaxID=159417 RepID=A0ABP0FTM8_CLALP